jgi:hypothetical protein
MWGLVGDVLRRHRAAECRTFAAFPSRPEGFDHAGGTGGLGTCSGFIAFPPRYA